MQWAAFVVDEIGFRGQSRGMQILDASGKFLAARPPRILNGDFCRRAYKEGPAEVFVDSVTSESSVRHSLLRAQVPWLVTLLTYDSEFQIEPDYREFFVYAPQEDTYAVKLAADLWRWWWKGVPIGKDHAGLVIADWPKMDDGAVAEPIDDAFFADTWKYVCKRKHYAAGHPEDPFAFTSTSGDVRIYKSSDFQSGLSVKI